MYYIRLWCLSAYVHTYVHVYGRYTLNLHVYYVCIYVYSLLTIEWSFPSGGPMTLRTLSFHHKALFLIITLTQSLKSGHSGQKWYQSLTLMLNCLFRYVDKSALLCILTDNLTLCRLS